MSEDIELRFNFRDSIQRVIITEDGKELFVGSEVCRNLGREKNHARTIKTYVKDKWWIEYPNPNGGYPILCLYEPGVYQLASNPIFKNEWASRFQDFMFEVICPKLRRTNAKAIDVSAKSALSVALPNTDRHTRLAFAKRDKDLNNIYTLTEVHDAIPYKLRPNQTKEHAILDACSRVLIYGHDYWHRKEDNSWVTNYSGREYLVAFARNKESINLEAFGNTHVVLNMLKFLDDDNTPRFVNGYRPSVKMKMSALMKASLIKDWYPISEKGLQHFKSVWNGKELAVWDEFCQLCSTLDTDRYVRYVRNESDPLKFDTVSNFKVLENRGWLVKKHIKYPDLWTLISYDPSLFPSESIRTLPDKIEYRSHILPRSIRS